MSPYSWNCGLGSTSRTTFAGPSGWRRQAAPSSTAPRRSRSTPRSVSSPAGPKARSPIYHQVGTGNYNEKTAKLYTDLSLITADPVIGADAAAFFQNMAIGNFHGEYQRLLASPLGLRDRVMALIDREIAKAARATSFSSSTLSPTERSLTSWPRLPRPGWRSS